MSTKQVFDSISTSCIQSTTVLIRYVN